MMKVRHSDHRGSIPRGEKILKRDVALDKKRNPPAA
jgi:hypothetical protein